MTAVTPLTAVTGRWRCALELDEARQITGGSAAELARAIGGGADLRVHTEFRHNEHIDTSSDDPELVREVAEFGVTYLIDGSWSAGIMSLRQPVDLPEGFGPRPSMSFFLYNQDGQQAIGRPLLDGPPASGAPGPGVTQSPGHMPRYHAQTAWDDDTNAPSYNFIYDFDVYRYCVCERWQEALAHDADGTVVSGSIAALAEAFSAGCHVKVGVGGLCADLVGTPGERAPAHEVFVQTGSGYYYTERQLFIAGSHPVIRVRPATPMLYESHAWDFGWLVLRTDGHVVYRRCDPYTLAFEDRPMNAPIRWFVA